MSNLTSTFLAPHPEYYINGGDLYLVAGNTQYRVHSYFFERDSEYFKKKLNSHAPLSAPRPGSSDANAIAIKHAGPREFEKLLWVFYNPKYSLYEATASEWITILKLACDYRFHEVKLLAIRGLEMSKLTTVELIHIYELYRVERKYLVPLYDVLCRREECLTEDEAKELGLTTTLLIFRLREILRSQSGDGSDKSPLPPTLDDIDITRIICSSLGVDPQNLPGTVEKMGAVPGAPVKPQFSPKDDGISGQPPHPPVN